MVKAKNNLFKTKATIVKRIGVALLYQKLGEKTVQTFPQSIKSES